MICPWCEKETEFQDGFCSGCGGHMSLRGTQNIQLGSFGFFAGHLDNLLSGSLEVEIYICDRCRKIEFYSPVEEK